AVNVRATVYVVAGWSCHSSMSSSPSTNRRTPSSAVTVNSYEPAANTGDAVHRAENPSAATPGAGAPPPQSLSTSASHRDTTAEPASTWLPKYSAKNSSAGQSPPPGSVGSPKLAHDSFATAPPAFSRNSRTIECG